MPSDPGRLKWSAAQYVDAIRGSLNQLRASSTHGAGALGAFSGPSDSVQECLGDPTANDSLSVRVPGRDLTEEELGR